MTAKAEELLYMLFWTCEMLSHPTMRNVTESFESWAYRNGLLRQLQRLEQQRFLERAPGGSRDRLYRLTEAGRVRALGGRDPEAQWRRAWDGRWRLVLFDIPETRSLARRELRRYLQDRNFGCLQDSVWITPDPVPEAQALLRGGPTDVKTLILLEAQPCGGESDQQVVAGAWDFDKINRRYALHELVLKRRPRQGLEDERAAAAFRRWLLQEQRAWRDALQRDPLLPAGLHPSGYAGRAAWRRRGDGMAEASAQMKGFKSRQ